VELLLEQLKVRERLKVSRKFLAVSSACWCVVLHLATVIT